MQKEFLEQDRVGEALIEDLRSAYSEGQEGRGTLDYLRIVGEPSQSGVQYRNMLSEVRADYVEFSRPPYAVDPLDEQLVKQARMRGVCCRLLLERGMLDEEHTARLREYCSAGVEVRQVDTLPMKLAVFDSKQGLIALLDPVVTKPGWTAVVFDHEGMGEAMKGLFEEYWRRGAPIEAAEPEPLACGAHK
jgi:hypothetical protein